MKSKKYDEDKVISEKDENIYLNYLLSLGYVLLIIVIISLIVFVSRYSFVDSNANTIRNTQEIIKNIENLTNTTSNNNFETQNYNLNNYMNKYFLKNFIIPDNIIKDKDIYLYNKNKTIISFIIDKPLLRKGNIFYIPVSNYQNLKGTYLYIDSQLNSNSLTIGNFLDYQKDIKTGKVTKYLFYNFNKKSVDKIGKNEIIGKVVFVDNNLSSNFSYYRMN